MMCTGGLPIGSRCEDDLGDVQGIGEGGKEFDCTAVPEPGSAFDFAVDDCGMEGELVTTSPELDFPNDP